VPTTLVHREQSGCGDRAVPPASDAEAWAGPGLRPASHLTAAAAAIVVVVAAAIGGEEAEGDGVLQTQIG